MRAAILAALTLSGCGRPLEIPEAGRTTADPAASPEGAGEIAPCAALRNEASCEDRGDCHGVYTVPECNLGGDPDAPCGVFRGCVEGRAHCEKSRTSCDEPDPRCPPPYAVGYDEDGFCSEGCVLQEKCSTGRD